MLLRWTAAAFAAIALAGLLTRLLPDTFPISAGFLPERVSFPLTYWNAMGIACAVGALLALHLTSSGREPTRRAGRRRRAAAGDRRDALPDVLARRDLGAADRVRALRAAGPAARRWSPAARRAASRPRSRPRSPTATSCWRARTTTPPRRPRARAATCCSSSCSCARWPPRRCASPRGRWTGGSSGSSSRREARWLLARRRRALALLVGAALADAPRRIADARATFTQRPVHGVLRRPAHAADLGGRQRADRQLARSRWTASRRSPSTAPAPGPTGSPGTATAPAPPVKVNDGHSLYLETMSEMGIVGLVLLLAALGTILVGGAAAPRRGRSATRTARSSPPGRCSRSTPGSTGTGRCPRCSSWLFGAGGVVLASRRPQARRAGRGCRGWSPALAVLVLAMTPALFAYSQGPLDRAVYAFADPRLRRRDQRRADRHRALRHAAGAVDGARLLRRPARPVRAGPPRDGRRPLSATRTTGSTPTGRRSSTACRASTRAPTPARRCG